MFARCTFWRYAMETLSKTPNQIVAYNLRRARVNQDWTQADVAEQLGISRANYSLIESSYERDDRIRNHSADDLVRYAEIFGLPVLYFLLPPIRRDKVDPTVKTLLESVDVRGRRTATGDYLDQVWPPLNIRQIVYPDHGMDAFERRLSELSALLDVNLTDRIEAAIESQASAGIRAAMPTVFEFYEALSQLDAEVRSRVESLQRFLDDQLVSPAWKGAIEEMTRMVVTEGDEEE